MNSRRKVPSNPVARRNHSPPAIGEPTYLAEEQRGDLHPSSGDWGAREYRRCKLAMRTPSPSPVRSRARSRDRRECDRVKSRDRIECDRVRSRDRRECNSARSRDRMECDSARSRDRRECNRVRSRDRVEYDSVRSRDKMECDRGISIIDDYDRMLLKSDTPLAGDKFDHCLMEGGSSSSVFQAEYNRTEEDDIDDYAELEAFRAAMQNFALERKDQIEKHDDEVLEDMSDGEEAKSNQLLQDKSNDSRSKTSHELGGQSQTTPKSSSSYSSANQHVQSHRKHPYEGLLFTNQLNTSTSSCEIEPSYGCKAEPRAVRSQERIFSHQLWQDYVANTKGNEQTMSKFNCEDSYLLGDDRVKHGLLFDDFAEDEGNTDECQNSDYDPNEEPLFDDFNDFD